MDILQIIRYVAILGIVLVTAHIVYTIWYALKVHKKTLNKPKQ